MYFWQFQQMLRDAAHGGWSYVVVWKTDRFARNRYDSATYKYRLRRYGVRVLSAKENIPEGPEGILLESILEGSAEYYSSNLSQNIRRGQKSNALECKVNNGSIPYGFCKGPDGRFAVVEAQAQIVRDVFQKVADGVPFVDIINDLNARGIRTKRGGLWNKNSFRRMLRNELYIGVYVYSDTRIEGGCPAIIDKALFLEVAKKLETKKKTQGRHRENGSYMLTGKLFCGLCGSPMTGVSGTGKHGDVHYYYVCNKRRNQKACTKENVTREWIEKIVVDAALDIVLQPDIIEWVADRVMAFQEREGNNAQLLSLRDELSAAQKAAKKQALKEKALKEKADKEKERKAKALKEKADKEKERKENALKKKAKTKEKSDKSIKAKSLKTKETKEKKEKPIPTSPKSLKRDFHSDGFH